MSVDRESVPQPDGRVRQRERGQACRGRQGTSLQSYFPARHYLDFLKQKTLQYFSHNEYCKLLQEFFTHSYVPQKRSTQHNLNYFSNTLRIII